MRANSVEGEGLGDGPRRAKRGIPAKADFNEWYPAIVEIADLVDKRYPIKGMDVWRPYGWKAMRRIDDLTHAEMERTGHEEVHFPLLIPAELLAKENRLVARLKAAREADTDPSELRTDEGSGGFVSEVYWVRQAGDNELDAPMFLRPTSETAMYTMFPLWVRSHADLPLKVYQMVNTFRYETKQTRSFIRVREIHFFEAHTAHVDEADATRQIDEDLGIVGRIMHDLCLPVLFSKRPVWDTFPGAWYTIGIDVVMPNGRTLQVASCHHYRDQWAEAFDLTYEDMEGENRYCHQTTYGMSERLLGAVVGIHGDDSGLIFPPSVAPYQVVIVPIASHQDGTVDSTASDVADRLRENGLRVHIDGRDLRPGSKYYDWEIRGVPLRLDIGPRDVRAGTASAARRTGGRSELPIEDIVTAVRSELSEVAAELRRRAAEHHDSSIRSLDDISAVSDDGIILEVAFDSNDTDAEGLERSTGMTLLGEAVKPFDEARPCIVTGRPTTRRQHLAKMY